MATSSFKDRMAADRASWSESTREVHTAVSAAVKAEVEERTLLGSALAEARKDLKLSQSDVSEIVGVQQSEISRIERGVHNPTLDTLARLGEAVGLRLAFERS
ncbi:helix-turn-helix domain-containing protein [Corynebacterium glyciniphilum]|uniref:helix-turn-helix domain-containing protein n=1 Tax=Corynebacterium glyciniphilum TaxID=1404244 RepID=UPI00265672FC|nr:helix-turn-helix transcriptional regulator [Corynebacterium glyciniphilum]MDN5683791.1 helix-turn-helix domain-containing protein [Corynebacterium glyciniphilum]